MERVIGAAAGGLIVFGTFVLVVSVIALALSVLTYVFEGIAMMRFSKKLGLRHGWMGFVPFANSFLMGQIAEQCPGRDGEKQPKFSIILLIFAILTSQFTGVANGISPYMESSAGMNVNIDLNAAQLPEGVLFAVSVLVVLFGLIGIAISVAGAVFSFIAIYRILQMFIPEKAAGLLVLCIFVQPAIAFVFFAIRDRTPVDPYTGSTLCPADAEAEYHTVL